MRGNCSHTKQFCDTSWVSSNLTQLSHYLPWGIFRYIAYSAQSHETAPTLISIVSSVCHQCFWAISYKSEIPKTLTLGSINLIEQLTELRKAEYLLITGLL